MGFQTTAQMRWLTSLSAALLLAACSGSGDDEPETSTASPPGQPANQPPSISGEPPAEVIVGTLFDFQPTATDPDSNSSALQWTILNTPQWASFNSATGRLAGIPDRADVGSYSNIKISVSDGSSSVSLEDFAVVVTEISSGNATLSWQPPTRRVDESPLTNLAGYRIYYGSSPGRYSNNVTLNNPGITTYVVENLTPGRWYFTMTAFDSDSVESELSDEASKSIQ